MTLSERARLRELEVEVRELRLKSEFLGSCGLLRPGISVSARYEFIDAEKATRDEDEHKRPRRRVVILLVAAVLR